MKAGRCKYQQQESMKGRKAGCRDEEKIDLKSKNKLLLPIFPVIVIVFFTVPLGTSKGNVWTETCL